MARVRFSSDRKVKMPKNWVINKATPDLLGRMEDVSVSYIRDPGALNTTDPSAGLWQGRMITPDILSPETLRYAAQRSQVFNTIMHIFMREIANFARRPMFDGDVGFSVVPKIRSHHMTPIEKKEAARIEEFLLKTGRVYNPTRTDTLRDYLVKQVFNTMVYDRMVTEVVWSVSSPFEFRALDGATVIKVDPLVYIPQTERGKAVGPISFIQLHSDQIWAEFNKSELIFGIRNSNPSLLNNGYGVPELEELIEPVTIEIQILTYIDRMLTQGSIPEGLLIMKSPRSGQTIESISLASGQSNEDMARMLRNQIAGVQNAGRLAVLRLRGGEEAQLIVQDRHLEKMPFIQTYEIVQNQISRKLGVDPAQVGIVTGSIKNSFTDADAKPSRTRQSHNRSMTNILYAIGDTQLNPLIDLINPEFCVQWHGIDTQIEQERLNLQKERMDMGLLTLNQVLAQQNMKKWSDSEEQWWANIPLHPLIFQAEAAKRGLKISGKGSGKGGIGGANEQSLKEMMKGAE